MAPIPLTKAFAGQSDLDALSLEIDWLGPEVLVGQAPQRAFEYGLALRALRRWEDDELLHERREVLPGPSVLDVGGAGSLFAARLAAAYSVELVDPKVNTTLEERQGPPADVILAISTIEHVPDAARFLCAVERNLLPGGLAFLTFDLWGRPNSEPDTAHFSWLRERIYSIEGWQDLAIHATALRMQLWGEADFRYQGDQLYGSYSFGSLSLRKQG